AEAVREIDGNPALLDLSRGSGEELGAPRDGQVECAPEMVVHLDRVAGSQIEWRRQVAFDAEERLEDLAYRLPEAFGGVLHARRLQRKPAVPRRRVAHPPMIEPVHDPHRQ